MSDCNKKLKRVHFDPSAKKDIQFFLRYKTPKKSLNTYYDDYWEADVPILPLKVQIIFPDEDDDLPTNDVFITKPTS